MKYVVIDLQYNNSRIYIPERYIKYLEQIQQFAQIYVNNNKLSYIELELSREPIIMSSMSMLIDQYILSHILKFMEFYNNTINYILKNCLRTIIPPPYSLCDIKSAHIKRPIGYQLYATIFLNNILYCYKYHSNNLSQFLTIINEYTPININHYTALPIIFIPISQNIENSIIL